MRVITVSGTFSSVGKTHLARQLKAFLAPRALVIKIGHGPDREKPEQLFHDTQEAFEFALRMKKTEELDFLIVESNRILEGLESDLSIFIASKRKPWKKSARIARDRADIIINEDFDVEDALAIMAQKCIFSSGSHHKHNYGCQIRKMRGILEDFKTGLVRRESNG